MYVSICMYTGMHVCMGSMGFNVWELEVRDVQVVPWGNTTYLSYRSVRENIGHHARNGHFGEQEFDQLECWGYLRCRVKLP